MTRVFNVTVNGLSYKIIVEKSHENEKHSVSVYLQTGNDLIMIWDSTTSYITVSSAAGAGMNQWLDGSNRSNTMLDAIINTLRSWQGNKHTSSIVSIYDITMGYGVGGSLTVHVYKVDLGYKVEVHKPVRIERTNDGEYLTESVIVFVSQIVSENSKDAIEIGCRAALGLATATMIEKIKEQTE